MARTAVLGLLTVVSALRLSSGQLSSSSSAFNPLSGQGAPPNASTWGQFFPVKTGVFVQSLLAVNENSYSFDLNFIWMLEWQDPRAYDVIMGSDSDNCSFYCASMPNSVQNADGQSACCDGVYVPQADSINLRAYDSQTTPYRYDLQVTEDGTVKYQSQVQGTWSCTFDYGGYPWDRHYLIIDIYTSFNPILDGEQNGAGVTAVDGFVVDSQNWGPEPPKNPSLQRPSSTSLELPGWAVRSVNATVMSFTEHVSDNPADFRDGSRTEVKGQLFTSPGVRVAVEIQRETRIFYCVIVILPIALIVLFAFGMFSIARADLKARVMLLATQFLTLIILQFVLSSILPASYNLLAPYYLVIVSYAYTFILFCIAIMSHSLLKLPERRSRRLKRAAAKSHFTDWRHELHERAGVATRLRRRNVKSQEMSTFERETGIAEARPHTGYDAYQDSESEDEGQEMPQDFSGLGSTFQEEREAQEDLPWVPSKNDYEWYRRQKGRLYFKFPPFRRLAMWHKFIGMNRSRAYVESLSHQLEYWSRLVLLVLYVALIGIVFGIAAARVQSSANFHVLPSQHAINMLKEATNLGN